MELSEGTGDWKSTQRCHIQGRPLVSQVLPSCLPGPPLFLQPCMDGKRQKDDPSKTDQHSSWTQRTGSTGRDESRESKDLWEGRERKIWILTIMEMVIIWSNDVIRNTKMKRLSGKHLFGRTLIGLNVHGRQTMTLRLTMSELSVRTHVFLFVLFRNSI